MNLDDLDRAILAAHAAKDIAALVPLYRQAGETMIKGGNLNAGCFFLTHAYIYALDCGDDAAPEIHQTLVAYGREE